MIVNAALGISAGVMLAGALAAIGQIRAAARILRLVAMSGFVFALAGVVLDVVQHVSNGSAPFSTRTIAALIALGGAAYTFHTKSSPFILLTGGLLLTYATLSSTYEAPSPRTDLAKMVLAVASASTLPTLDASVRKWRRLVTAFPVRELWFILTLALIASVWNSLLGRGAWLGSTGRDAWLVAAWICGSGGLLLSAHRAQAALLFAAALALALSALSA